METQKCIWMLAGSVEYQLCPLKRNCDLCDFHKQMMEGYRPGQSEETSTMIVRTPELSYIQFTAGLQFMHRHFWLKRTGDGKVLVGMDTFMWQILSAVQRIVSAKVGTSLVEHQCFIWLQLKDGIIYLRTPIPGKILSVNPLFEAERILDPHLYLNPEEDMWFVELEIDDLSSEIEFMSKELYLDQTRDDIARFTDLKETMSDQPPATLVRRSLVKKKLFSKYLVKTTDSLVFNC